MDADPPRRTPADELARVRRQRAVLADFGFHAVRSHDLDTVLQESTQLVSEACEIELVKIVELLPGGDDMLIRAGVNWAPGVVGHAHLGADRRSPAGYALLIDQPVVSPDVATETRFDIPEVLRRHRVRSMINVVIRGEGPPFGVLEVDSRAPRAFDQDDSNFLQLYANLLASAVDRLRAHAQLTETLAHRGLLLGELQHRVKNLFGNIRALAHRTARAAPDVAGFLAAFDERLDVLARTQEVFALSPSERPTLRALLGQELGAHGADEGERVVLRGADFPLPAHAAQALGMAFHELATNAGKYGALGTPGARLEIGWELRPSGPEGPCEVLIQWRERGVAVPAQRPRGFGIEMVERGLPHSLGGSTTLTFHPDGIECRIRFSIPPDAPTP